jgi:hypothetical protein
MQEHIGNFLGDHGFAAVCQQHRPPKGSALALARVKRQLRRSGQSPRPSARMRPERLPDFDIHFVQAGRSPSAPTALALATPSLADGQGCSAKSALKPSPKAERRAPRHLVRRPLPAHPTPIFLLAEERAHPLVPFKDSTAVLRSGGQGRSATAVRSLPLTATNPAVGLPVIGQQNATRALLWIALTLFLACLLTMHSAAPSHAETQPIGVDCYAGYITEGSRRFDIPAQWIRGVMRVESVGDSRGVSRAGAIELMQILPATWKELRERYRLRHDPFDPRDNIPVGSTYVRDFYDRYGSPGFLAASNAGLWRYEALLAGKPLPRETRTHVARLAPFAGRRDHAQIVRVAVAPPLLLGVIDALHGAIGLRSFVN